MSLVPSANLYSAGSQAFFFSPNGYRIDDFRSPVPKALSGAQTVDTHQARSLAASGDILFIDVLPTPPRPKGLPESSLWLPPKRHNIPGTLWLPNVGYGALSDELDDYFRQNLQQSTRGRWDKGLLFYCQDDCWMSWNAARRALEYGYTRVYWYPAGTDGWTAAQLPLAESLPAPR